jgi:hypothetical protein
MCFQAMTIIFHKSVCEMASGLLDAGKVDFYPAHALRRISLYPRTNRSTW